MSDSGNTLTPFAAYATKDLYRFQREIKELLAERKRLAKIVVPNTKIRQDSHGCYVRTNGQIYRPYTTRWSYPVMQPMYREQLEAGGSSVSKHAFTPDPDLFAVKDEVRARAQSQTPYAVVEHADGRKAYWWGHGAYQGVRFGTEGLWTPESKR
jgi:hypothetical protein